MGATSACPINKASPSGSPATTFPIEEKMTRAQEIHTQKSSDEVEGHSKGQEN